RERIAQVCVSHADELGETRIEAGSGAPGRELRQHDAVAGKGLLRKPAGAAAAVLPEILQDVGHLQPLRERHGELGERVVPGGDRRGIGAEELGEHLAHDAGDVVAVAVEVARARQPAEARAALKLVHAAAHESDAALDRGALDRKSTRLNSSHLGISYAVFCLKKKTNIEEVAHIML